MKRPEVSIYGAGPAGLMAAEVLASAGAAVFIHDRMAAPARKFLLAGRGGLNLTHSEPIEKLLDRYGEARAALEPAIRAFPPPALAAWAQGLGIETYVGSSGRVFPKCMKASPLLRAWLKRLQGLGVTLETRSPWPGFTGGLQVLAFGGASYPHLGSDAAWVPAFDAKGIRVNPFKPANCRFLASWTEHFAGRFAGLPLKNVLLRHGHHSARGEVMISKDGIEGGAIYVLSRHLRDSPQKPLHVDLRPDLTREEVAALYAKKRNKDSLSNFLRKSFGLLPAAIGLMHETKAPSPKDIVLKLDGPSGLSRAISSAGGVALAEVDEYFQLRKVPGTFIAGEMLDWEAPTGGYLLQACLATGAAAARGLLQLQESLPRDRHIRV